MGLESAGTVSSGALHAAWRFDAVNVLTVYLVLLVGVPATLVVGPLGSAGTPAGIFGAGCLGWWGIGRLDRRFGPIRGRQPMRVVVALFMAAMLCGYLAAMLRAGQPLEVSGADRTMLRLLGGIGVLLLAADGLHHRTDLERLLRRASVAAGVLATVGLVQFVFGVQVTTLIQIPGLESHSPAQLIQQRSTFRRVSGTTSHPIEFGVTLAMLLPIALHCAFTAPRRRSLHAACTVAIVAAIPMSISRSAMLGLVSAWVVMVSGWDSRRRTNALILTPFVLGAMRLAVPGLLGTIKSLFTGLSRDPSITGRTQDYDFVNLFIDRAPWFGRGLGTFLPELYTTLDNQYLGQIVETGYVGLFALLLLLGSGVVIGWLVKRRAIEDTQRSLGVSLAAAAIVPFTTFISFDALSFPVITGFTFLILGCAGAATRLHPPVRAGRYSLGRRSHGNADASRLLPGKQTMVFSSFPTEPTSAS